MLAGLFAKAVGGPEHEVAGYIKPEIDVAIEKLPPSARNEQRLNHALGIGNVELKYVAARFNIYAGGHSITQSGGAGGG